MKQGIDEAPNNIPSTYRRRCNLRVLVHQTSIKYDFKRI